MPNKAYLCFAACVAVLLSAGTYTHADIIFSDNFNSGASPLWGNEAGNWIASGGVYYAQNPANIPNSYTSLPFSLTDFSLDLDINGVGDGGIYLRSLDSRNGILLVTGGNGYGSGNRGGNAGTSLYWHVIQNGAVSPEIDPVDFLFVPGVSDAHLHITVDGDNYAAYLNGSLTPVTTLQSNAFAEGHVALYDNSQQTFDNVELSAVPEPSTLILLSTGTAILLAAAYRRLKRTPTPELR